MFHYRQSARKRRKQIKLPNNSFNSDRLFRWRSKAGRLSWPFGVMTVFLTVLAGVLTYILGQLVVKLLIDPVQDFKRTIGIISHTLILRADVIANPGVGKQEVIQETSEELRKLASLLRSHLYLIPLYQTSARVFQVPSQEKVLAASSALIGLSNSVFEVRDKIYEINAKRVASIHDSLGIFLEEGSRWPEES